MNARQRLIAEKIVAMSHYSDDGIPKCSKCGDTRYVVLDFHHVDGKGNEHRRELGRASLVTWLKENSYPNGFTVLCANCHRIEHGGDIIEALDQLTEEYKDESRQTDIRRGRRIQHQIPRTEGNKTVVDESTTRHQGENS